MSAPQRWMGAARLVTLLLSGLIVAVFAVSVPVHYRHLVADCLTAPCAVAPAPPPSPEALAALGISGPFYMGWFMAIEVLVALVCLGAAAVVFWRQSHEPVALLAVLMLLGFGLAFWPDSPATLATVSPLWSWLVTTVHSVGFAAFFLFFLVFPDGRFRPTWTGWAGCGVLSIYLGLQLVNFSGTGLMLPVLMAALLAVQTYRYRKLSGPVARSQTRWVIFGLGTAIAVYILLVGGPLLFAPELLERGTPLQFMAWIAGMNLGWLLVPLSIAFAVLRHRLWDVDPIINRTLVYGALSALVVGTYVLVVGYFGTLLGESGNMAISLVATGIVAVLFQPLRNRLQRGVNRLLYGDRDDPYAVLSDLSHRLGSVLSPDSTLPALVTTIRGALRLPYVAVSLERDGAFVVAARDGEAADGLEILPLRHAGAEVGQLLLAPRSPGEPFSPADRRLLEDLARQAGAAVQGVRLNRELQRSREQMVLAREEERRRLRRDLHDDLAPKLAALALTASAAEDLVATDTEAAARILKQLRGSLRETVGDIRRLVYDLRPPTLDELGLVAAIRERALQYGAAAPGAPRLAVDLDVPDQLPPLPAAVEVAAYRIVQEALMNVHKHASAEHCGISLAATGDLLEIIVTDDGVGLPQAARAGVGLRSMRERAAELGGRCEIGPGAGAGTQVRAWLPLTQRGEEENE